MNLSHSEFDNFYSAVYSLLDRPEVKQMNDYIQHGHTTCLDHCLAVSYYSYLFAKRYQLHIDYESLIRGALLHDFFLYDWHIKESHERFHGYKHPAIALENAKQHFDLTPVECDIIKHHMWPLTPTPPHSKEAYIVTFIDKWCSLRETFKRPTPPISVQADVINSKKCMQK